MDTNATAAPPVSAEDIELRVGQYVNLRDRIADIKERHKKELEPFNEAMEMLNDLFMREMKRLNVSSLKASTGTVSVTLKDSASAADPSALWTHIVATGEWELLDKKPNLTAVREYIEKHGVPPPGVNYSSILRAGVRRK